MIDQGIKSLDTGAPDITYEGNEGVKSPEQEMAFNKEFIIDSNRDNLSNQFYGKDYDELNEEEIIEIDTMMENMDLTKGPVFPSDEDPVNPFGPKPIGPLPDRQMAAFGGIMGLDQRKQYGIGSKLKRALGKVTKPFTKVAQKLMPKELAGIARMASPFLPGIYGTLAYAAGTAKQKGRLSPMDLALMAAPYAAKNFSYAPGEGISFTDAGSAREGAMGFGETFRSKVPYGDKIADTLFGKQEITGDPYSYEQVVQHPLEEIRVGAIPGTPGSGLESYKYQGMGGGQDLAETFIPPTAGTPAVYGPSSRTLSGVTGAQKATSGLIGKGGEMYQLGNDVGILDTKAGQLAFGTPSATAASGFAPSKLKLGSWAVAIVSGIKAGKYKDEQDAADAAEAAALAADSEASEATLAAARAWAIETFGSMSVYADGGRIGFASGTKDPSDVIEGMDNELNPGIIDSILKGVDKDHGYRLIHEIQDYKYGRPYEESSTYGGTDTLEQPPMSMEETIKDLEAKWDAEIEEGMEPGSYNDGFMYFQDMGIYNKEDIRRRVELGYDSAKGPESSEGIMTAADGGRINKNMGGEFNMPPAGLSSLQTQQSDVTPQGMELDLRGGGFIPIGKAEKADDVPARVSKNEFVFTADAVKAAGGGSVNEGAKRMYDTMKRLESQVG